MLKPIKIYDSEGLRDRYITKRKSIKITSILNEYDKRIQFSFPSADYQIYCEDYIEFEGEKYVVKEVSQERNGFRDVTAILCLEELENKTFVEYSNTGTAEAISQDVTSDTGWTLDFESDDDTEIAISVSRTNAKDLIEDTKEQSCLEVKYDSGNKVVYMAEKIGKDRGVIFLKGINLIKVEDKTDTYDYCTRLIPIGKGGIDISSVNNGKNYIDADGAKKIITQFFTDEAYGTPEILLKASRYKLDELSKPNIVITVKVLDLYRAYGSRFENYFYDLGDEVRIVDEKGKLSDKYRISKMVEYPDTPEKNTIELANRTKSFEDYAKKLKAMMKDAEDAKIVISGMSEITDEKVIEICS